MSSSEGDVRRVCVIGAGTAGLCAVKHCLDQGFRVVCYEQGKEIGGTWIYSENSDSQDEFQNSMYQGLRTNLPKEVMGYPDFPFSDDIHESYITADKVLRFLESYAKHFRLEKFIQLRHEVLRVRPKACKANKDDLWEVYVKDCESGKFVAELFDFVFVCNGHYNKSSYPVIEGMKNYKGRQIHSHFYKTPKSFEGETVLVIGSGPSGLDIANQLQSVAKSVLFSHHSREAIFFPGVVEKPDVKRFTENGAIFQDGSSETFSAVVYCTGFKYSFPFLSMDCGVHIKENAVQPLFRQVININHPTMAFIGLPSKALPTQMSDLQVRFALKYFSNELPLPTREYMLNDLENELRELLESGRPLRRFHEMAQRQYIYYDGLASLAQIKPIEPVILKIMQMCVMKIFSEVHTYRDYIYKILDDSNFEAFKTGEKSNATKLGPLLASL